MKSQITAETNSSSGNIGQVASAKLWEAYRLIDNVTYSVPIQFLKQTEATKELVKILAQQVDNDRLR